ncbi:LysE family translocator [Streptomyces sp. NPDC056656]|uniref:LysE family translocator n=1 Tax=Streptomyces sp. NPDC056656 TaxID=3345895 RepID=UPI0036885DBD
MLPAQGREDQGFEVQADGRRVDDGAIAADGALAFEIPLTVAGAVYLMWLGWGVLRRPAGLGASTEPMATSRGQIMLKGAGISGLNPKALLLYFSLFPQFIRPADGWPVAAQTGLLSVLHMTACAVVYLAVGVLARTVLRTRPSAARAVTRSSGAMMIVIGGFLLAERLAV